MLAALGHVADALDGLERALDLAVEKGQTALAEQAQAALETIRQRSSGA